MGVAVRTYPPLEDYPKGFRVTSVRISRSSSYRDGNARYAGTNGQGLPALVASVTVPLYLAALHYTDVGSPKKCPGLVGRKALCGVRKCLILHCNNYNAALHKKSLDFPGSQPKIVVVQCNKT